MWSQYPTEIESDLLPKADIHDWHRGTLEHGALKLSSRRLLVLLDGLPDDSTFKRAGDWPELYQMIAAAHKELSAIRYTLQAVNGVEDPDDAIVFLSPTERVSRYHEAIEEAESREESDTHFYGEMGMS